MKRAWLALVALGGCAVGPDFHTPAPPSANAYTAAPLAPGFAEGADIPGEWWTLFHSKPLDDLIERALRANPDLAACAAARARAPWPSAGPTSRASTPTSR